MTTFGIFKKHLRGFASGLLDELSDLAPEAPAVPQEAPIDLPPDSGPSEEGKTLAASPDVENPFVEIPDEIAFQIRDLVQEKQQIFQGLQLIRGAFTAQTQRIDALYQELRIRYEVPKDPEYVLHISEGEGDPSGFKFLIRTSPPADSENSSKEKEQTSAGDNSSMDQRS